ncbi:MAG: CoA-acylating methylmalonate-semialdehyde dehydrogenase [Thermoleophilia bacterium]|nr:CoA-acylating methylmalonate-semialdehyde dehydrogenase [Thermoleophilia bacterium]
MQATALHHWIGGAHDATPSARTLDVHDPATGDVVAVAPMASTADVDRAVAAAKAAAKGWRDTSLTKRATIMFAFRELLHAHRSELAAIVTREHGKVTADALGEVARGIEVVEFACGMPHLVKGEYSENVSGGIDVWSIRQPLGVVAGITPFNFPAMVPLWMFPIAIAAGNTFVLKPSEKDPSAAIFLAELFTQAGLPDGVFNVVHGDAVAVNRLLEHPDVKAISSVSSTPVARHVYETGTRNGKRVQALGGAKNHMVVLPDADMELAADAAIGAAFGSAGQRCMAISVLVAVGDAGDRLRPLLEERMAKLTTGPGHAPTSEMGPVVTRESRDKIHDYLAQGAADGAELVVDGRTLEVAGHEAGYWVGPTLFDHVATDMSIYTDEIFGPVLDIVRVDSWDDAMQLVNDSEYANGVALFTNDGGAARRFQYEVEVGMVGLNVPIPVPMAYYSFGGWKASLFGDSHMHGMEGVRFFTRAKAITGRWPDPSHRGVDLGFPTN